MILTKDIREHAFDKVLWGYEAGQVNEYLQQLATAIEDLNKQFDLVEHERDELLEQLEEHRDREKAIRETMLAAQRVAEDFRKNAETEAQLIIARAQQQADSLLDNALARRSDLLLDIGEFKNKRGHLLLEFKRMLEMHLDIVHHHEYELNKEMAKESPRETSQVT